MILANAVVDAAAREPPEPVIVGGARRELTESLAIVPDHPQVSEVVHGRSEEDRIVSRGHELPDAGFAASIEGELAGTSLPAGRGDPEVSERD